jgi:pilus assembly protein CpaC
MQQAQEEETAVLCILNLITMPEAQQVILEVKVASIDKTKLKELGISYLIKTDDFLLAGPGLLNNVTGTIGEDLGGAGALPGSGFEGFDLGTASPNFIFRHYSGDIIALLRAMQEKGFGKILAEPNLIVRSGEKGTFHVGRRIPIQTVYGVGASATPSITFEEVGVKLVFAPEVLETGVIRLKIDPAEVSNVIRYLTLGGLLAPEIDTRRVTTSVDLKEGESFIVAGLLSEEMKKSIQKIPILGDIPILGAFFRSTRDEISEKDLAFFITPRLSKPIAPGVKTPLPTDNRPTPEEEREFQWIPMPGSGEGADTTTETK